MSAPESAATAALDALGFALFLRDEAGALRLEGAPASWLRTLWPSLTTPGASLPVAEASPFLENFLIDAEECWATGGAARVQSGAWVEQLPDGAEVSLEATALTAGGRSALLLQKLGDVFEAKKAMLQHARETVIAYQRLNSETQKKEILLSCIAEEMNAALANAITALRLIELEKQTPRGQQLLGLALRAGEEQQALINRVLSVFATELEDLYGGAAVAASLGEALAQARENLATSFAEKRVTLTLPNESAEIAMDPAQLARVVGSLLENALENAPPGTEISVTIDADADDVLLRVRDRGPTLPANAAADVFSKGTLTDSATSARQLRLQFCRVAVENSRGRFGSDPPDASGNCVWIRLPRAATSAA